MPVFVLGGGAVGVEAPDVALSSEEGGVIVDAESFDAGVPPSRMRPAHPNDAARSATTRQRETGGRFMAVMSCFGGSRAHPFTNVRPPRTPHEACLHEAFGT